MKHFESRATFCPSGYQAQTWFTCCIMVVYTVSILCEREQLLQLLIEQVSMFLAFMFRTVSSLETQICRASAAK